MKRNHKILASVCAFGFGLTPLVLYAYSSGPDPRLTGAPGDDPLACTECHTGTGLNQGGGNVQVKFPNGLTYTPGVAQTLTIVVTDAKAKVYGFQMTARLANNLANGQAGDFTPNGQQIVICDNGSLKGKNGCPSNAPVEFIEHNNPYSTNQITVKWTPPASDAGNVTIYVAANAANGDGNDTGDHIYSASYTLTAASGCTLAKPSIAANGVVNGANFQPGIQQGSWVSILGTNLSGTTRPWDPPTEIINNKLPTSLDGVTVTIDGKPAAISFISPTQINVQAPTDSNTGPVNVTVTHCGGTSDPAVAQMQTDSPALFLFNAKYPAALIAKTGGVDFLGPANLFGSALVTRPAKPGEIVLLFGTGFGPTTPAVPAGAVFSGAAPVNDPVTVTIGGVQVTPSFAGLSGAGLYQINVTVPNLPAGDQPLKIQIGSQTTQDNIFLTVGSK